MWNKDELKIANELPVDDNLSYTSAKQGFSFSLKKGQSETKRFKAGDPSTQLITSNIHPWMRSPLLVQDNPYFCVTDERGIFCIPNLPTNEYLEFRFWHERVGYINAKSTIEAYQTKYQGSFKTKLTQPVTDFGEYKIEPTVFKE
jgi:hypothetical protein